MGSLAADMARAGTANGHRERRASDTLLGGGRRRLDEAIQQSRPGTSQDQKRVVTTLGAQFRSRAQTPDPTMQHLNPGMGTSACSGCASLNSKLTRARAELLEMKRSSAP